MADITILKKTENDNGWQYTVRIEDNATTTEHMVTVPLMTCRRITGSDVLADALLRESIAFLLKHERQESIMQEFEIDDIATYFSDWERTMVKKLS